MWGVSNDTAGRDWSGTHLLCRSLHNCNQYVLPSDCLLLDDFLAFK